MILKENAQDLFKSSPTLINAELQLPRTELPYTNLSDKFKYSSKDFTKQFAHIYAIRLNLLRPRILRVAKNKWGNVPVRTLADLADDAQGLSVVTGTLFKHQPLKPSVLKELSEEHQLVPQPPATHYTSPDDMLVLEDETQRVRLMGVLPMRVLVTGIVIAVKGRENEDGRFEVEDYCFPGVEDVPPAIQPLASDCYLALVSGLELSSNCDLLSAQLLADWLCGVSGGRRDQEKAAKVVRVVLAGGLVGVAQDVAEAEKNLVEAVNLLDLFCLQLARSIPVDVMPGDTDPSNHSLPQQPLHQSLLKQASRMRSCRMTTNPHQASVGGRLVLGHSGQPLASLARVTDDLDPLQLLQSTLEWGHVAPTAPDTLACYPYYKKDPFIIDKRPDIYFAGNQSSFQTSLLNGDRPCRLVCVPSFISSKTVVLVNLRTLDCFPLTFALPPS